MRTFIYFFSKKKARTLLTVRFQILAVAMGGVKNVDSTTNAVLLTASADCTVCAWNPTVHQIVDFIVFKEIISSRSSDGPQIANVCRPHSCRQCVGESDAVGRALALSLSLFSR